MDCDYGSYQPDDRPLLQTCEPCPDMQSTRQKASTSSDQCEGQSEAHSYNRTLLRRTLLNIISFLSRNKYLEFLIKLGYLFLFHDFLLNWFQLLILLPTTSDICPK